MANFAFSAAHCSVKTAGEKSPDKLTYGGRYAPRMLWGKILRALAPRAHREYCTSRARALPGVKAVITARDVMPTDRQALGDLPILARERCASSATK